MDVLTCSSSDSTAMRRICGSLSFVLVKSNSSCELYPSI